MKNIKFHDPDETFDEPYYLGSVPCKGEEVYFVILKDKDRIIVDSDTVIRATGNMTVEEFTESDVFLDIVSVYRQLTGKEYVLDCLSVENESVSISIPDVKDTNLWDKIKTLTLR